MYICISRLYGTLAPISRNNFWFVRSFDGILCLVKSWHAMGQSMGQHPFTHIRIYVHPHARSDLKVWSYSHVHFLPWQPASRQPVTTSPPPYIHHSGRSCLPPNNNNGNAKSGHPGNPLSIRDICSGEWPAGRGFSVWRHYTIYSPCFPRTFAAPFGV